MGKIILKSTKKNIQLSIVNDYKSGNTTIQCSKKYNLPLHHIRKILLSHNVKLRKHNDYYWHPSSNEIDTIIDLYKNKKHGIQFISDKFNTSWEKINKILLDKKIEKWNRSEICSANVKYYGSSSGFTGKRHSLKSRKKMSKSRLGNCNNVTGPKSRFIETCIGKVQGSYEASYLQQLFENGLTFPRIPDKVRTPYGNYFPDFEFDDRFVEIKSPFTENVCKGIQPNGKGKYSDVQYKKIKWTNRHVKKVEIVTLDKNVVKNLFLRAVNNKKVITETIILKNGQYFKASLLPSP